jgi:hypothetical protein
MAVASLRARLQLQVFGIGTGIVGVCGDGSGRQRPPEQVRNVDDDEGEGVLYFLSYRAPASGAFLAQAALYA